MTERDVRARRTIDRRRRKQERLTRTIVVAGVLAATMGIAVIGNRAASGHDNDAAAAGVAAPGIQAVTSTTTGPPASDADGTVPDLAISGSEEGLTPDCKVQPKSISVQSAGADVQCLQQALRRVGYYNGPISGTFDYATSAAVKQFQIDKELFVDGIAGRVTNMTLGIWP